MPATKLGWRLKVLQNNFIDKVRIRTIFSGLLMSAPRPSPSSVRLRILDCLRDPKRHSFHPDAIRFLNHEDFVISEFVKDLIEDLSTYELFPKSPTASRLPQKYQFVMRYDGDPLLIHITFSLTDSAPPRVKLGVHRHNIPGPPLPLIPIRHAP